MRRVLGPLLTVLLLAGVGYAIFLSVQDQKDKRAARAAASVVLEPVTIRLATALAVEPWVTQAAELYNSEDHRLDNHPIVVEVIPMSGINALNKWVDLDFNSLPTAWIAESRDWVNQANIAVTDRGGQDIFLAGGQYRSQPLVLSPMVWGIWQDAYQVMVQHFGTEDISWDEVHDAAALANWNRMGGSEDEGRFKLVVAHPKRDPAGLTAMVGAAGEFYDKPTVSTQELEAQAFLSWLEVQFNTVVDFSPFGVENMMLFGRSNGDAGQIVESYLLSNMEALSQRWNQPLKIVYPDPIAWFDFPYAIYMGSETSALEKDAALMFKEYLLSAKQQAQALEYGFRPACVECPSSGGLISRWQDIGVKAQVPSSSRMRSASRNGLDSLTDWYVATYEE